MLDHLRSLELFAMAELKYLSLEAMDLFERCLAEGDPDYLMGFVEEQILHDPPRVELLRNVAEELHQRLLSLREHHFDVRDRVVRTLRDDFQVDLTHLAPPNALHAYHLLELEHTLKSIQLQNKRLTPPEMTLLRKVLSASLELAGQLHKDVQMTEQLMICVMDWVDGLSVTQVKLQWGNPWEQAATDLIQ